jgi:hypothetical protein
MAGVLFVPRLARGPGLPLLPQYSTADVHCTLTPLDCANAYQAVGTLYDAPRAMGAQRSVLILSIFVLTSTTVYQGIPNPLYSAVRSPRRNNPPLSRERDALTRVGWRAQQMQQALADGISIIAYHHEPFNRVHMYRTLADWGLHVVGPHPPGHGRVYMVGGEPHCKARPSTPARRGYSWVLIELNLNNNSSKHHS